MGKRVRIISLIILVMVAFYCNPIQGAETDDLVVVDSLKLELQYAAGFGELSFTAKESIVLARNQSTYTLEPGDYKVTLRDATPTVQRFHVFIKTFGSAEGKACSDYVQEWREKGYDPEVLVYGARIEVAGGEVVDNRRLWVSLARVDTEAEADALIKELDKEDIWAWQRPEYIRSGNAEIVFFWADSNKIITTKAPLRMESEAPIAVKNVDRGFWREMLGDFEYAAPLSLEVGADGLLELRGELPLETYLAGVLPAEMSNTWPTAALEAQAIAARSEAMASLRGKHRLEGFDFCVREHCLAYKGLAAHTPETDAALAATRGEVVVADGCIVAAVFSANCGGWTESNEHVWSGPAIPVLRGVADFSGDAAAPQAQGMKNWITDPPEAYCAKRKNFRWTQKYGVAELSAIVNEKYDVGQIREIRLGGRGLSGRLTAVTVVGSHGTETIKKELVIRQAFGSLPSACFVISTEGPEDAPTAFIFQGAGYGHGVGMCQHGACGMAERGFKPHDILKHYFTGITIERLL